MCMRFMQAATSRPQTLRWKSYRFQTVAALHKPHRLVPKRYAGKNTVAFGSCDDKKANAAGNDESSTLLHALLPLLKNSLNKNKDRGSDSSGTDDSEDGRGRHAKGFDNLHRRRSGFRRLASIGAIAITLVG